MGDVQSTFIINKKEYISLKHVGKGSFGTVNLVKDGDGSKFILKTVLNNNSENEVRLMKLLSYYPICNPYIICLHDYEITEEYIYILMEYVEGSDLGKFIKYKNSRETDFTLFDKWFRQAIMGMCYMHNLGIIHRDIKPANLLIDVNRDLKYIDFGLSRQYKHEYISVATGTKCYKEPYLKTACYYTDIYALGITFVKILKPTVDLCNVKAVSDAIDSIKFPLKYNFYKELLHKMTRVTANRPSAQEILGYLNLNGATSLVIKDYKKCLVNVKGVTTGIKNIKKGVKNIKKSIKKGVKSVKSVKIKINKNK
jgi:serine/threonine protein kinase